MITEHHRCHRGARCARRQRHPDLTAVYLGAHINAERGLCEACTGHLRDVLGELPRDYVDLHGMLARVPTVSLDAVAGTREPPMPLRADVDALMSTLAHELQCWAESTSDVLGVVFDTQIAHHMRPAVLVQRCARILADAVPVLLALRDVVHADDAGLVNGEAMIVTRDGLDGAQVLIELHHRIRATAGLTRLTLNLELACTECGRKALRREDGSETVECGLCTHRTTWDDYRARCDFIADHHGIARATA